MDRTGHRSSLQVAAALSVIVHAGTVVTLIRVGNHPTPVEAEAAHETWLTLNHEPPVPPEPRAIEPPKPPAEAPKPEPEALPVPPPKPPPEVPPKPPEVVPIRAGIDDAKQESDVWKGFLEATEHQAPKFENAQAAMSPEAGPPAGAPPESAPAPESQPVPKSQPTPEAPSTDSAKPTPAQPVEREPQPRVEPQPEKPAQPAVKAEVPAEAAAKSEPPRVVVEQAPPLSEEGWVMGPPRPRAEQPRNSAPEVKPQPERKPEREASPQEPAAAKPSAAEAPRPVVPPTPRDARAPGATGEAAPGIRADDESDPGSEHEPIVVKYGKVLAGRGVEIRTAKPRFSVTTTMTARPKPTLVRVDFARDGHVTRAMFPSGGTGYADVDGPLLDAIVHRWSARGKRFDELTKDDPHATVSLYFMVKFGGE